MPVRNRQPLGNEQQMSINLGAIATLNCGVGCVAKLLQPNFISVSIEVAHFSIDQLGFHWESLGD